jgi:hypothetical protein
LHWLEPDEGITFTSGSEGSERWQHRSLTRPIFRPLFFNLIKNAILLAAIRKRIFCLAGHPEAGERSAVIYPLPGS